MKEKDKAKAKEEKVKAKVEAKKEEKPKEELKEVVKELPKEEKLSEADRLKAEIKQKEKIIEEQKNKLLRALADFDNYKKRIAMERDDLIRFSNEALITSLLPIIDNFERSIDSANKLNSSEELVKGLALIKRQFEDELSKFGVKKIEAVGQPFDPAYHEAVMQKEDKEKPDGVVLEEMQKGYTLHGKMIRPAMVIVNKNK